MDEALRFLVAVVDRALVLSRFPYIYKKADVGSNTQSGRRKLKPLQNKLLRMIADAPGWVPHPLVGILVKKIVEDTGVHIAYVD